MRARRPRASSRDRCSVAPATHGASSFGSASISLKARTTVPVGDIIFLLLVALAVGWVAVAAIRSHRGGSRNDAP